MLADRALFWPAHGALIVADLHLEKASWYAAHGQPLPPYDSHDTLDRLAGLAVETGARAIWCLGDSFHDRDAAARIAPTIAARLTEQAAAARIVWIAGNHDGLTAGAWGGDVVDELRAGNILFRHQSLAGETRPEISGHFHPKLRLNVRGRGVSRPCFAGDDQRLILPAFGSFTPAASCDLMKASAKVTPTPMTSPVDFISGPRMVSTPGNLTKGKTASLTEKYGGMTSPVTP